MVPVCSISQLWKRCVGAVHGILKLQEPCSYLSHYRYHQNSARKECSNYFLGVWYEITYRMHWSSWQGNIIILSPSNSKQNAVISRQIWFKLDIYVFINNPSIWTHFTISNCYEFMGGCESDIKYFFKTIFSNTLLILVQKRPNPDIVRTLASMYCTNCARSNQPSLPGSSNLFLNYFTRPVYICCTWQCWNGM